MVRAKGRPRIRFADPHRLRPPAGDLASSLQTLRVCLTLAPSRVRAQAMGTKKPGYRSSRAVAFGADNGARTRDPNLGKVVLYQLSHVRLRVINLRELSKRRKYFFQKTCLPHVLSS